MSGALLNVTVCETGSRRHKRLGDGFLTKKRVHALGFGSEERAAEAAAWLFETTRARSIQGR